MNILIDKSSYDKTASTMIFCGLSSFWEEGVTKLITQNTLRMWTVRLWITWKTRDNYTAWGEHALFPSQAQRCRALKTHIFITSISQKYLLMQKWNFKWQKWQKALPGDKKTWCYSLDVKASLSNRVPGPLKLAFLLIWGASTQITQSL